MLSVDNASHVTRCCFRYIVDPGPLVQDFPTIEKTPDNTEVAVSSGNTATVVGAVVGALIVVMTLTVVALAVRLMRKRPGRNVAADAQAYPSSRSIFGLDSVRSVGSIAAKFHPPPAPAFADNDTALYTP